MSYITSSFSPYRSKDLKKEFLDILAEDREWICSSLESRGLLFAIAFISIMSLSLLKAIIFLFEETKKPQATYKHLALSRNLNSESITSLLSRREDIDEIENEDNLCPDVTTKNNRVKALSTLRSYLYQHNFTLNMKVLKKVNHRVDDEDLISMCKSGEITTPLSTTHITLGNEINALLKEVLENTIDLRINKFTKETYIRVLNDDFYPIQEKLSTIYNEPIRFTFD